jgi:hypothetical protein
LAPARSQVRFIMMRCAVKPPPASSNAMPVPTA